MIQNGFSPSNRVLFVACILFIPVFDTLRVIILRLLKGDSPFSADREHTHHILLDLGLSHKKAGIFLASLNLLVISTYWFFSNMLSNLWLSFLVAAMYGAMFLMFYLLKKKSVLRIEMKEAEDRGTETEGERSHVIMHNGLGQGIKVGRPEKIQGSKFKVKD
jgi:hypothetical protein